MEQYIKLHLTMTMLQKKAQKNIIQNGSQVPDHSFRVLLNGDSGYGKKNDFFYLIKEQDKNNY